MFSGLIMAALAVALVLQITRAAVRTYTGQGLSPCIYPELSRTDAVKLATGTYAAGTVMGQVATLTTQNDIQTITFGGTPTGGTFRLSFNGVETADITWSGTAATLASRIQAALAALPQVGSTDNVAVSSSITVPTVTFQGALAGQWQPLLVNTINSLTSGTTATVAIAHTTPGRTAGGTWRAYDDTATDGTNIAKAVLQYATIVTPDGLHYSGGGNTGKSDRCASVYTRGYFRTADLTGLDAAAVTDLGRIVEGDIGSLTNVGTVLKIN